MRKQQKGNKSLVEDDWELLGDYDGETDDLIAGMPHADYRHRAQVRRAIDVFLERLALKEELADLDDYLH